VRGIGLLSGPGIAAAGLYAVGHACTKGALFLVTGLLLNRFETLDEHELYRRGRGMWVAGAIFVVGGLALAGLPPFGTWAGKAAFSTALADAHQEWLEVVLLLVSALTGGSVLRAGLRIFAGIGDEPDPGPDTHEEPEGDRPPRRDLSSDLLRVLVPPVVLLLVGVWLALGPGVAGTADRAGATLVDPGQYSAAVLRGVHLPVASVPVESLWSFTTLGLGVLGAALATGFALASLWAGRLPSWVSTAQGPWRVVLRGLHAVHRAHVGDYVSWVLVGFAVLGATLLLT
jgi:multicomponent Na+:H+ antiporter subunit D